MTATAYARPATIDDAVVALASAPDARPIAGGTDLMVQLRHGVLRPSLVVDLSGIAELREVDGDHIGAAATLRSLLAEPGMRTRARALTEAAELLGGRQIQAMATVGGNLCNGSPAAETAAPLLVHDAEVQLVGPGGRRTVPLAEFWTGPRATVLAPGELVTSIVLGDVSGVSAYRRLELRRSVDIAVVAAAARLQLVDGRVTVARLAIAAAAPTPRRVPEAEALLVDVTVDDLPDAIEEAARLARAAASPIDDTRATAGYRRSMVQVMAGRALRACVPA